MTREIAVPGVCLNSTESLCGQNWWARSPFFIPILPYIEGPGELFTRFCGLSEKADNEEVLAYTWHCDKGREFPILLPSPIQKLN